MQCMSSIGNPHSYAEKPQLTAGIGILEHYQGQGLPLLMTRSFLERFLTDLSLREESANVAQHSRAK